MSGKRVGPAGTPLNPEPRRHNLGYCAHLTGDLPGAVSAALVTARLYLDRPPGAPVRSPLLV